MSTRRWLTVAIVAALSCAAVPARATQIDEQLPLLFSRAELLQRSGDAEGALAVLDRLILAAQQERALLSSSGRLMLRRSHELRALLHWDANRRSAVDSDLDQVIELDPGYELPAGIYPQAMRDRFRQRRERKVGFLRVGLFPADAVVTVDGVELQALPEVLPVLAGEHQLSARKPGFAPASEEAAVRANRTVNVNLELSRSSATIRLSTVPPGAKLVVDGDVIGSTMPPSYTPADQADDVVSEPLLIDGLLPGWHEIEVTLAGYRPFRQRIEVPDLSDYDLGILELPRSEGIVLLRGLPADSAVTVDGEPMTPTMDPAGPPDAARLVLPVGEHALVIDRGAAGSFERSLSIEEGRTMTLDVVVRPAIAWLGVVGGDQLDRDAVRALVAPSLQHPAWTALDREADGAALLEVAGVDAAELLHEGGGADRLRAAVRARLRAGVYVLAVLPDQRPASRVQLLVWGADEAAAPARLLLELGVHEGLEPLTAALASPLPPERAWIGLQVADSMLAAGALVLSVQPAGPAALAGLVAGSRIVGVDGQTLGRAAELDAKVASSPPFATLVLQVEGPGGPSTARVTLGSSPWVPGTTEWTGIDAISWAALAAARGGSTATAPDWSLALGQAMLALRSGHAARAADLLTGLTAPTSVPFGRAALDYWLGTALFAAGIDDDAARGALQAAAAAEGRLAHNDGPLVAPMARARLRSLPPR